MRHAVRTTIAVAALSFAVGLVACGGAEPPTAQAQDAPPPPAYVGEVGDLTSDQIDRQRRAEQGNASAQINLGVMYATGRGVPQDDAEAVRWFRLAAEQGHDSAQYNLGFRYDAGEGVPQDAAEAARWFRLAAEQGHDSAQSRLGLKYATGEGVPQDYAEAVRWYRLAAEPDNASAQVSLGLKYATGEGVPQDLLAKLSVRPAQVDGIYVNIISHGSTPARTRACSDITPRPDALYRALSRLDAVSDQATVNVTHCQI